MKKICLLMSLMSVALSLWSQNLVLGEEDSEDEIAIVGYFCKNDTMTFRQTHNKYKIEDGDTTISDAYWEDFMIVVTDSTSDGYKMKYIPLGFQYSEESDTVHRIMQGTLNQLMQSTVCEFSTDELGQFQRIDNWREIREKLKSSVKIVCDSLYAAMPELDSISPRRLAEGMLQLQFSTEKGIRESYEELDNLFGLHGNLFDVGDKELDSEENGYPQHIVARIGYIVVDDEEQDFDGDYAILSQSTTLIPVEDVIDLGIGAVSMMMSDMVSDSLEVMRDALIDSLKAAMPQGVEMKVNEYYEFFFNGWPKEYYYEKIIDTGLGKDVETRHSEWISRHWNIYYSDDEKSNETQDI